MEEAQTGPKSLRTRFILGIVLLLFFLFLLAAVYLRSPYAKIRVLSVEGAPDLATGQLLADAGIEPGENLFAVSGQAVSHRLMADFPIISSVEIKRDLLQQSIKLVVHEKAVAGILETNGALYLLLSDGTVLDRDPEAIGVDRPIITLAKPVDVTDGTQIQDPTLLALIGQLAEVPSAELRAFSEFHIEPWQGTTMIQGFTKDGFEVRMPVAGMAVSLRLYKGIHDKLIQLHEKPGVIDLFSSKTGIYSPYSNS